ncbi:MAG: hypothetical protein FD138_1795, partial [Planctomycetota bacterium]
DVKDVKSEDDPLRKPRVQFLKDAVKHFEVQVGEEAVESKLHPNSVLVWNNPVSGTKVGILAVFARNGRPDVMAQFSFNSPQSVINEFHNFCGDKLVMKRGTNTIWTPAETSTKWQKLDTSEKPAATPPLRLVQMRRLAEKFTVEDEFGWDKKELNQLRLLTTPVHRYGKPDEETIDGAVFVYALATDPEAVLMLECVRGESGLSWRYGFGPMSIYALKAKLDDAVVWEIPERKVFGQTKAVQYVFPYQLAPGEKFPE